MKIKTRPTRLSPMQKLHALAAKYYQNSVWVPKAGDCYTTSRADLELYNVVDVRDGKIFTEYATRPGELSEWEAEGFTTEGFGPRRVYVPDWVFDNIA